MGGPLGGSPAGDRSSRLCQGFMSPGWPAWVGPTRTRNSSSTSRASRTRRVRSDRQHLSCT
eukprot:7185640-Alexandrium_andersonii.AAC.1